MTAEKWKEFDEDFKDPKISYFSREAYKSALRKAIHEEYKVRRLTSSAKAYFLKLMETTNPE